MVQCKTNEELLTHKCKHAESQRNYEKAKRQCVNQQNEFIGRQRLDSFVENTINCHNVGKMNHICSECKALMFQGEQSRKQGSRGKFSLCCSHGAVQIPSIKEPPDILKNLFIGSTKRDHDFQKNIRAYNSSLAFASMCLTGKEYDFQTNGPFSYRINGQVYHLIRQLQPENGKPPGFSQIYIYDKEHELDHLLNSFNILERFTEGIARYDESRKSLCSKIHSCQ